MLIQWEDENVFPANFPFGNLKVTKTSSDSHAGKHT